MKSTKAASRKSDLGRSGYTLSEVATRANFKPAKIYSMLRRGLGPKITYFDGTPRVTPEHERDWIQSLQELEGPLQQEQQARIERRRENARRAGKLAAQSPRHVSKKKRRA